MMAEEAIFDAWPERYDEWFTTPIGRLVKEVEGALIEDLLAPRPGENLLDAGCGTGVFTVNFLAAGARVVGIDISRPMLLRALGKTTGHAFFPVQGDMQHLPFAECSFDKAVSITALEFIADAGKAIDELFRVTRPGGHIVVATLNSLSPWAERRRAKTLAGQRHLLEKAFFRSPDELLACSPSPGIAKTAVHFPKGTDPQEAMIIERRGQSQGWNTGAFVAALWEKPAPSA